MTRYRNLFPQVALIATLFLLFYHRIRYIHTHFSDDFPVIDPGTHTKEADRSKDWMFYNYTFKRFEGMTWPGLSYSHRCIWMFCMVLFVSYKMLFVCFVSLKFLHRSDYKLSPFLILLNQLLALYFSVIINSHDP